MTTRSAMSAIGAFFDVFGVRFRTGRKFDATDFGRGQNQAIVVNRTFATEIAGTENVLGRRVRYVTPRTRTSHPGPSAGTRLSVWSRIFPGTTTRPLSIIRYCLGRFAS